MTFAKLDQYLKYKTLVDRRDIAQWHCIRYTVSDYPFAIISLLRKRPIITLKCIRSSTDFWRKKYPGCVIAPQSQDNLRWNSVYLDAPIPDEDLIAMIDESYQIAEADIPALEVAFDGDGTLLYSKVQNAFDFSKILKPNFVHLPDNIDFDALCNSAGKTIDMGEK